MTIYGERTAPDKIFDPAIPVSKLSFEISLKPDHNAGDLHLLLHGPATKQNPDRFEHFRIRKQIEKGETIVIVDPKQEIVSEDLMVLVSSFRYLNSSSLEGKILSVQVLEL